MLKQKIQSDATDSLKQGNHETTGVLRMVLTAIILKEKEKRYKISLGHIQTGEAKDLPAQAGKPELGTSSSQASKEQDIIKESELNDEEIIGVIFSEIKKRKDAIVLYEKGNRQELADKEKKEIEVLQKYLPEQLSQEELGKLIQESIVSTGAKDIKDMRKVMSDITLKVKGRADNSEIAKIIKKLLSV